MSYLWIMYAVSAIAIYTKKVNKTKFQTLPVFKEHLPLSWYPIVAK